MAPAKREQMFLQHEPWHRLQALFRRYPVLAQLWALTIRQWRDHLLEVIGRATRDRAVLSQMFFDQKPLGKIDDVELGLSDPHFCGRSVVRVIFENSSIIYKPGRRQGEAEWHSLLNWMNRHGFHPALRAAPVLQRRGYCWMEDIAPTQCSSRAAARRFYQRVGGTIVAAYLLKAVDCHRQNMIAAGEQPVVVDLDALWHVSAVTKTQSPVTVLLRTGFFPSQNRRSLQSRSSVLAETKSGIHLPRVKGAILQAADFKEAIVKGFAAGWKCILGTHQRNASFCRRVRRIRSRKRRWIYWATVRYIEIRQASIEPGALRSSAARRKLVERLCTRGTAGSAVKKAEIESLLRLDIPYFIRRTDESMPAETPAMVPELTAAIRNALSR
ncbi:MAG TPA: type 2 lanthipeptide synthetase LanM [Chthoniobacterales bacterium]|nr:type 2 lanthipeptide synthetase LanM [Chthoniobacterales bacterium]